MPIDNTTPNQGYQLPDGGNDLSHDVLRLSSAALAIDVDVAAIFISLAGKSNAAHSHTFAEVSGLQSALDSKAAEGHGHNLGDMGDVDLSSSQDNQFLMKSVTGWIPAKINGSHIQEGTINVARLPAHLAVAKIADKTATQTISGAWSFNTAIKIAGNDVWHPGNLAAIPQGDIEAGTSTTLGAVSSLLIAQAIAAQSGGSGEANARDIRQLAISVAELKGSTLNMADGIADSYEDETGIDTGASLNQAYDGTNKLNKNATLANVDLLPTFTSVTKDNYTVSASNAHASYPIWKVVDDNAGTWWQTGGAGHGEWIKIDAGSGNSMTIAEWDWDPYHGSHYVTTMTVAVSDDNITWTDVQTYTGLNYNGGAVFTKTIDSPVAGRYIRFTADVQVGVASCRELNLYEQGATQDMTLQSNAFVAGAQPDTAYLHCQVEAVDAITINTDLKAWQSRDGGTTFSQATLVAKETYGSVTVFEDTDIDLSAQPAGTSMVYKITTHNGKHIKIHAITDQWKPAA